MEHAHFEPLLAVAGNSSFFPACLPVCLLPQVLGTDSFYAYLNKYGLELDPQLEALVGRWARCLLLAQSATLSPRSTPTSTG